MPVSGGVAAYRDLNDQQRQAKQQAEQTCPDAAQLGPNAHKKLAEALGIFFTNGKPAWNVVAQAGGSSAFKGASAQGALMAKGLALQNDVTTLNAGRAEVVTEA